MFAPPPHRWLVIRLFLVRDDTSLSDLGAYAGQQEAVCILARVTVPLFGGEAFANGTRSSERAAGEWGPLLACTRGGGGRLKAQVRGSETRGERTLPCRG